MECRECRVKCIVSTNSDVDLSVRGKCNSPECKLYRQEQRQTMVETFDEAAQADYGVGWEPLRHKSKPGRG